MTSHLASDAWRTTFAGPAIEAERSGINADRDAARRATVHAHDPVQSASSDLITALDAVDLDLHDRTNDLNITRTLATGIGVAFVLLAAGISLWFVRRYGLTLEREAGRASVLNRFTEVTTFAVDDQAVAASNLEALRILVKPDSAMTHVLNRSKDRAVPEAHFGLAAAEVLPLHALSSCPGVVRGSVFVD